MLRPQFLPLSAIAALALSGVGCSDVEAPATNLPQIDIGDGSQVTAHGAVKAIRSLTAHHDVIIFFRHGDEARRSVVAMSQETMDRFPGDQPYIEISEKQFSMNDLVLTLDALRDRLQQYAQKAELVGSETVMLIAAKEPASGERLVTVFHELSEAGITTIGALP